MLFSRQDEIIYILDTTVLILYRKLYINIVSVIVLNIEARQYNIKMNLAISCSDYLSKVMYVYRRLSETTSYLAARTKNIVSQCFYGRPVYGEILCPRGEIDRSSTARWDIRTSSSARRDRALFRSAVDMIF